MQPCLDESAVAAMAAGEITEQRVAWVKHVEGCERCRQVVVAAVRAGRPALGVGSADDTVLADGSDRDPRATVAAQPRAIATAALGVGDTIGRYKITGLLGAGGMGVVYEALDPELDRLLAIKLLRNTAEGMEHGLTARLVREAKALAQLAHPNVVTIHDVGEHAGHPFLAMEFVRGTTLRVWLEQKRRPWRDVAAAFEQAARGLAAAHAAQLVHRDFKPDNVMVGSDGRVRVTDFGLVRPAATREGAGSASMTAGVVSTSKASDAPSASKASGAPSKASDAPSASTSDGEPSASTAERERSASIAEHDRPGLPSDDLTQSGALLGTPAYMSPEQHRGEAGDAKSDQFNFMVALYEAVYGARPFRGRSAAQLALAVLEERPAPPPAGVRVPRWLRRLIDRGLEREPAKRYSDMNEVAGLLARGLERRRTTLLAGAGAAVLAAVTTAAIVIAANDGAACRDGSADIAKFWNESAKGRMRFSFVTTGKPFAADAARAVTAALDHYGARWAAAHLTACEATQSPELLDLRMACLTAKRAEMESFVELLTTADAAFVEHAPTSAAQLSNVDECANVELLGARVRVPAAIRGRVDELNQTLAKARATAHAGRYREALELAQRVADEARALGYRPLEAEAHQAVGADLERLGQLADAERAFREAIRTAEAGGHDELKAEAWASLVSLVGEQLAKPKEAIELERQARAVIERVRNADLTSDLDEATARALQRAGDYPAALRYHNAALATRERLHGKDDLRIGPVLDGLVGLHMATGEYTRALAAAQRVLAIRQRELGRAHPLVAKALINVANTQHLTGDTHVAIATMREAVAVTIAANGARHLETALVRSNYGTLLERAGRFDEAIVELDAALELRRELLGPKHADVATTLMALGTAYKSRGDLDRAERFYRECLALREEVLGPDHPEIQFAAGNLGAALGSKGDYDGAEKLYRRALAIAERTHGPEHPSVSVHLTNLARLATERGKPADAVPLYLRALASDEKRLGKDHVALAYHLSGLGPAYIDVKKSAEAVPVLERSIALWTAAAIEDVRLAEDRMMLADALIETGGDRERAGKLVTLALETFEREPRKYGEWIDYAKKWQRKYGRR